MSKQSSLYEIPIRKISGQDTSLAEYSGKVILVVNVASKCGLTPQYEGLERLYERYREKGLEVLGFPANQFLGQEPGSNEEIAEFCQMKFGIKFPMFEKIIVKGEGQHPLYSHLTQKKPEARGAAARSLRSRMMSFLGGGGKNGDITWNFEKFLVSRKGEVIERFAPTVKPEDPMVVEAVERALES